MSTKRQPSKQRRQTQNQKQRAALEARRQAVLTSSGEGGRDLSVQRVIDGVLAVLRRSEDSEGFLFFTTEQRAIGELLTANGVSIDDPAGDPTLAEGAKLPANAN